MMYLTEERLGSILKCWGDTLDGQVPLRSSRFRVDFLVTKGTRKIFVEFDGYLHFTCPEQIERDNRKNKLISETYSEYELVRIPYFVQLDEDTFKFYFNDSLPIEVEYYPHGFIDKKAKRPNSFCFQGILKYKDILEALPVEVAYLIKDSTKEFEKAMYPYSSILSYFDYN